ncbi:MAG TPA: acyloxyacyl hydrolase [Terriglobales bacterium]|jgi:hypothetical protein|nr:acyloxyacyl hydrolase [Terriglobales bacterium]
MRKRFVVAVVVLLSVAVGWAQDYAHETLTKGSIEIGPWVGGGTGVGIRTDWHFFNAGVRVGKVLTSEIGSGALRGNFEFAGDIIPVYLVMQPQSIGVPVPTVQGKTAIAYFLTGKRETVYGYSFNPVVLTWNFTRGRKVVPFFSAEGGLLVTRKDVPFPDTDHVNFTPGGAFGAHFFLKNRQAITLSGHVTHISNASLGEHNPGINASIQFRLGYTWFK